MASCLRATCGHPDTDHDVLGFCSRCPCVGFLHEDDALLGDSDGFVLDDEDDSDDAEPEPLDFDEDG